MKLIRKVIIVFIVWVSSLAIVNADRSLVFEELDSMSEDELVKAVYELGVVSSAVRALSSSTSLNLEDIKLGMSVAAEFQHKVQVAGVLMNFVCAQVYVNHLKDLRAVASGEKVHVDLDLSNHFNKNNGPSINSLLSAASRQGAANGAKLVASDNRLEIEEVILAFMDHLSLYFCREFEDSYRKLFDIEDVGSAQHPYYALFCDGFSLKVKEDLKK